MKKILLAIPGIIILILLVINFSLNKNKSFVTINDKTFYVDVAKTDLEREKGLSIYNSLSENKGMIFTFKTPDYYAFWMKDMKFAIDIIYIRNNRIIAIYENVKPPKTSDEKPTIIKPNEKSDAVLEINANLSKKYNFKIGDFVKANI